MKTETRTCVDCAQSFDIGENWYKLMKENPEIRLPKRCYDCRRKKKERNREQSNREFKKTISDSHQ